VTVPLRAVVFDVDGTLAETERDGHRVAFNEAFVRHGLPYRWSVAQYGELLGVTGGVRRLAGFLARCGHPGDVNALATAVHRTKTALFLDWVAHGEPRPRQGVSELLANLAVAGISLGVATTGGRSWVVPLLDRLFPSIRFEVVVTGDDVRRLKPEPDVYLRALRELGRPAAQALAVEDSALGLRAARAAGLACLVVPSPYTAGQDFAGAAAVLPGFRTATGECLSAADCRRFHSAG